MTRRIPRLPTDEAAEDFLAQDLSDLDFSQFKPFKFHFAPDVRGERSEGTSGATNAPSASSPQSGGRRGKRNVAAK